MLQHTTHEVNMLVHRVSQTPYHTGYLVTNLIDMVITPGSQLKPTLWFQSQQHQQPSSWYKNLIT